MMKRIWGAALFAASILLAAPGAATAATANLSGTVATGGLSQLLDNANLGRGFVLIENPSGAGESLYVGVGVPASTAGGNCIEILPGGSWSERGANVPKDQLNVTAATTGHPFIAIVGP
jgi:hypothetical protein